jgi:hypothetical protein
MLGAQFKQGNPGAGQRYAWIVLTNTSTSVCEIFGYGGIALQGKPGTDVPTDLVRSPAFPPAPVLLKHGQSVASLLHWSVVPGVGEPAAPGTNDCEPTAVNALVTPPDEYTSITLPWSFGPVCQHGHIEQRAYVAGNGSS